MGWLFKTPVMSLQVQETHPILVQFADYWAILTPMVGSHHSCLLDY